MRDRQKILGDEVRDAREAMGFRSRETFAAAARVSLRSIDKVENGEAGVGPKVLGAVARTLGWRRADLEAFLSEETDRLPARATQAHTRQTDEWVISATYPDLGVEADRIQAEEGPSAARRWMEEALRIRQESETRPATERDVS